MHRLSMQIIFLQTIQLLPVKILLSGETLLLKVAQFTTQVNLFCMVHQQLPDHNQVV